MIRHPQGRRDPGPMARRAVALLGLMAVLVPLAGPGAAQGQGPDDAPTLDTEAAVEQYLGRLTPEERQRSDAYFEGGYWLDLWTFLWGAGVALALLATGLSARLRDLAERLVPWRWLVPAGYGVQYVALTALLTFPLTLYRGFYREHAYGLSNQSLAGFLRDEGVSLAVATLAMALLLVVLYAVFRRFPRRWWLWGAGVAFAFVVLALLVAPVYIMPLFNAYTPLEEGAVRDRVLTLARANGIEAGDVYVYDASRQSDRISANVSGLAGTLRISLNDNLLERGTPEEIEAVMAHEIGHYVLGHIPEGLMFLGIVIVVGFALLDPAFRWLHSRFGARWQVRDLADPAGLPLMALLFATYLFLLTPLMNSFVRGIEAEADLFALNASRRPEAFASMAVKLAEYRKLDPEPWEEWLFYDHPSGRSRIEMAMRFATEMERLDGARR